jgi:uncharacterized membrane protein
VSLHLTLVHFPIALLVVGAGMDLIGAAMDREPIRRLAGVLLMLGAGAAVLAFLTGQDAADRTVGRIHPTDPRLDLHAQWGAVGSWALAGAGVLRGMWKDRLSGTYGWINVGIALVAAALVVAIGLTGTEISHGS